MVPSFYGKKRTQLFAQMGNVSKINGNGGT